MLVALERDEVKHTHVMIWRGLGWGLVGDKQSAIGDRIGMWVFLQENPGRPFWMHLETGESQWEKPVEEEEGKGGD